MKKNTVKARVSRTGAREALVRAIHQLSDRDLSNVTGGDSTTKPTVIA
jgi:hypothetical protein